MARAALIALLFVSSTLMVSAQESAITFPVAELGNCGSKSECHAYCDDLAHINECVAFAESHGLMDDREAAHARQFARLGGQGPGGCTSKESCETYCEDSSHMRQCLQFAKETGMMGEQELKEAEKVATYIESGGAMPGGCRGERQCRTYCEEGEHMEECVQFATKAGFMSEKEVEIFRKTGGKGPGGCNGRQCEAYCKDESHREQCIAFALEHDLMSEEDKQRMQEGMEKASEALKNAPPEVLSCIEAALGSDMIARVQRGEGIITPKFGEVLPACFREVMGDGSAKGPFGPDSAASECMRKVFGEDYEAQMRAGTLDPGARDKEIRTCMLERHGEGFLNDTGQWERPERGGSPPMQEGTPPSEREQSVPNKNSGSLERQYRDEYQSHYDARRTEMEEQMRAEIERQMQGGEFDPSKLPPDFKPEGYFPPPESFNRPPEGSQPMEQREPMSMETPLLANALFALQFLLGVK